MSHESYAELVAAYALDALDSEERARFEAHLGGGCPECEPALVEYREALARVVAELPPAAPPERVKTRLLERMAAETGPAPAAYWRRRWRLGWIGAAALAASLLAYLAATVSDLRRDVARRADEVAVLRAEVARQQQLLAVLGAPDTRVVALAGLAPSPTAQGRIWWRDDTRQGFFAARGLPPLPAGKTYQLWVISGGKPISAGLFAVDEAGMASLSVGPLPEATRTEVFAVTLEPAGGLPAPSGQIYLAGKLS
jgi:anti-sigma-K factor RskA